MEPPLTLKNIEHGRKVMPKLWIQYCCDVRAHTGVEGEFREIEFETFVTK